MAFSTKVMAALAMLALFAVLALEVPSSAMAARAVPDDSAQPEWPCCRQYDTPPSSEAVEVVTVAALPAVEANLTAVTAETGNVEPEWPCCRQYDTPPAEDTIQVEEPILPAAVTSTVVTASTESAGSEDAATENNDEPEWPCCRQYDTPPASADNLD